VEEKFNPFATTGLFVTVKGNSVEWGVILFKPFILFFTLKCSKVSKLAKRHVQKKDTSSHNIHCYKVLGSHNSLFPTL